MIVKRQIISYYELIIFLLILIKFNSMSIFQIPKKNNQQLLNKQKYNKIYVLSRKKCNPFLPQPSTLNALKFNLSASNKYQNRNKMIDSLYNPTERLFQSENHKQSQPFTLQYQQQSQIQTIIQKRQQIKQKLVQHFHFNTLKSKYDRQKNTKLQSFRQSKAINSKILFPNFKNCSKTVKPTKQLQLYPEKKKNSLPDLSRHTIMQLNSVTTSLKKKKIKEKAKLHSSLSINNELEFIRTGIINGSKISNLKQDSISKIKAQIIYQSSAQTIPKMKSQNNQVQRQSDNYSPQKRYKSINLQYPFINKSDHKNVENHQNQKISTKNILEIRRRRSLQYNPLKITKLNGQSIIKIQKLTEKK